MRWIAYIILILLSNLSWAQSPNLRRICPAGQDNNLYWNNPNFPCADFKFYILWERKGNTGPFLPVDTIYNLTTETYLHLNATAPLSEPNSTYFIERRDSCGPTYNHYSDTLIVDVVPPAITELDSVSVDINTNKVNLGWNKNSSPDFDKYLLYYLDGGFFVAMTPSETRDTFATDLGTNNPSVQSITYNINTRDSCGKLPAYEKRHSTILLTSTIDTCSRLFRLTWSHYVGWSNIKKYYIFKNTNNSGYLLIDSVLGNISTYSNSFVMGNSYDFYVRAIKDTSILISSSSNKSSFSSRQRIDPSTIFIDYVTSNQPINNNLSIQFSAPANEESKKYILHILDSSRNAVTQNTYQNTDNGSVINLGLTATKRYLFVMEAFDLCNNSSAISDTSTNILLTGFDLSPDRYLKWNPYFTWNTGVESYLINRGTGSYGNIFYQNWKTILSQDAIDNETISPVERDGICYYIEATKVGDASITSKSNNICLSASFTVFIPNAFSPFGNNPIFKPRGNLIDEKISTMKIYNRWGILVFEGNLETGWDGLDKSGNPCADGVYFYMVDITSTKNDKQTKNGTITLLR